VLPTRAAVTAATGSSTKSGSTAASLARMASASSALSSAMAGSVTSPGAESRYPRTKWRGSPPDTEEWGLVTQEHLGQDQPSGLDPVIAARLRRNAAGLFPVVVQEHRSRDVLMLAWMDDQALHQTLTTGRATYWSRSRGTYWVKGETSGHHQHVRSVAVDCDGDTVLLMVEQLGPACHTGTTTCFTDRLLREATS
jgi:phosphoribosyl-AMP cyclohydrolase